MISFLEDPSGCFWRMGGGQSRSQEACEAAVTDRHLGLAGWGSRTGAGSAGFGLPSEGVT